MRRTQKKNCINVDTRITRFRKKTNMLRDGLDEYPLSVIAVFDYNQPYIRTFKKDYSSKRLLHRAKIEKKNARIRNAQKRISKRRK